MNNPDTTPTPRTDAIQYQGNPVSPTIENKMLRSCSRQLERELSEKTNEVARLRELLDGASLALERAIKKIPKGSTVVPYEDALWKIRKELKQITKCNQ